MFSKIYSSTILGIDGSLVAVEVDVSQGLPALDIVGLPDSAVKESKERVRTAIKNCGLPFPIKHITINLAPADIRKEGPVFDLPIAMGILSCQMVISESALENTLVLGELSLDGTIRPVQGVLPMVYSASKLGVKKCIVPFENGAEAALSEQMEVYAVHHLKELIDHLNGTKALIQYTIGSQETEALEAANCLDFSDVKGQELVKRAIEIAAAGGHNLLMIGPPGSGKSMLAKRIPTILPDLTFEESMEITKIYSVAGLLRNKNALLTRRPFRAPHHTISPSALTGGGRIPHPGEISLAHNGVLFLDELPEFQRNALEIMRQPLEDRKVTISRVNGTITYPADFMLIAAMNPCPCGYLGDNRCHCTLNEIEKYTGKISGPLLDRIDIFAETPAVNYSDLENSRPQESSAAIKERVVEAHKIQLNRFKNDSILFNAQLSPPQIEKYCILGQKEKELLKSAFHRMRLSARAYHKILKVARTIADLEGSESITARQLLEAIQYRSLDRKYKL